MADAKPQRPGGGGGGGPVSGSLQRRVIAAFTQNLLLKGTAVFLAVVLWFVVNAKEPQVMIVPVRFESRTCSPSRTSVTNWPRITSGSGSSAVPTPSARIPTCTDFT